MAKSMTPEQRALVQKTFQIIQPDAERVGTLFYQKFFKLDPSAQKLFRGDMKEQVGKLMRMVHIVVQDLDQPGELLPKLENLGRIHYSFSVKDKQFDTFKAAFLWMLEESLGKNYTKDVRAAWNAMYDEIAAVMKDSAHKAQEESNS